MVKKSKGRIVTIDFTGVEAGGGAVAEGKYEVEVVEVTEEEGEAGPYLAFEYKIIGPGKAKGKLWDNVSLSKQSLWRARGVLEALGVETPDDEADIDLDDLMGRTVGVEVSHETYNKKVRARITDFFEMGASEEDEETPKKDEEDAPKKKKKKGLTSDDVLELDDEGLEELVKEHELEVDLEEYNTTRRKRAAVIEALTEAGVIEEE